ncbi:MAG: hypothetical protein R6V58_01640 [Planctomycetota bacterium]
MRRIPWWITVLLVSVCLGLGGCSGGRDDPESVGEGPMMEAADPEEEPEPADILDEPSRPDEPDELDVPAEPADFEE